jgi:hypothetical protein
MVAGFEGEGVSLLLAIGSGLKPLPIANWQLVFGLCPLRWWQSIVGCKWLVGWIHSHRAEGAPDDRQRTTHN